MWTEDCCASEDYYTILGVRAEATPEEIRDAYRERVRFFRLDSPLPPEQVEAFFKSVRTAYEALSNPASRAEYDLVRRPARANGQSLHSSGDSPEQLKSRIVELEAELARVRRQRDDTYRLLHQAPFAQHPDDRSADGLPEQEGTPIQEIIAEYERASRG